MILHYRVIPSEAVVLASQRPALLFFLFSLSLTQQSFLYWDYEKGPELKTRGQLLEDTWYNYTCLFWGLLGTNSLASQLVSAGFYLCDLN